MSADCCLLPHTVATVPIASYAGARQRAGAYARESIPAQCAVSRQYAAVCGSTATEMYQFKTERPEPVSPPAKPRLPLAPPGPATTLKECRCIACRHWDDGVGICWELGLRRYVPRDQYHPAMRQFWTDLGMIAPAAIHYCASYLALWRPRSRHVGAGSTIAREVEQGCDHASVRHERQGGQDG